LLKKNKPKKQKNLQKPGMKMAKIGKVPL